MEAWNTNPISRKARVCLLDLQALGRRGRGSILLFDSEESQGPSGASMPLKQCHCRLIKAEESEGVRGWLHSAVEL